ncbi:uncharacterized protein LOC100678090 [Nasonia vitripennis]|uniref:Ribosomal biogenesis protein LAS1L n=1 Tax=Nasonia vitripennis TaxID=7425 RepID=A0A7M7HBW5_NASVI|nr:uncharacterized protein LOC100678090 [Nasonia vitripennis]
MALIGKREDLVHVPWSSVEEWLQVYKQIYSGDLVEQNKAHEILLVWKARIPKLPVGVECTLGLIQVCLRDREWTPKIYTGEMNISYENDLKMMYSTVIMKFLNHISNIAHHKQTSLFVIAKQLNIPDWIVDLRHDTAHGHELPSIDVMRVVANILLTWLHEEYWAAEAKILEDSQELEDSEYLYSKHDEDLLHLIELWTAIGLYMKTKHARLTSLPDTEIKDTLVELFKKLNVTYEGKPVTISSATELSTLRNVLLSEISKNLYKGDYVLRKENVVIDSVLTNEAFLTNSDILAIFTDEKSQGKSTSFLPESLIEFWKDFLLLLQEKKLLLSLFLQLIEVVKNEKDTNKKLLASLWIKAIAQAFNKQKIARHMYQTLEQKCDHENKKLSNKDLLKDVQNELESSHPELTGVLNLNVNGDFPSCLTDSTFVKRLILNFNEYSEHYIPEILKISSILDNDSAAKDKLMDLIKIQSQEVKDDVMEVENVEPTVKVYTIDDIKEIKKHQKSKQKHKGSDNELADSTIRNTNWKLAPMNYDWSSCPIGILPWQKDDLQTIEPLMVPPSEVHYATIKNLSLPKIVDSNRLKMHSKIQWENLLKKKKKKKSKKVADPTEHTLVNRAVKNAKSLQQINGER